MRQLVQDLRSGALETVEVPEPVPGPGEVLVRTAWSLISPGTERAVSETAGKGLIGKARARPDEARQVVNKALRDGVGPTIAAVRARLDDPLTPGYSSAGVVEELGAGVEGIRQGETVGCFGANAATHAEKIALPAPLCLPLPEGVESRSGAFAALGGVAAHGVRLAGVEAGSVVVVIGLGLVGQLVAQLATAAGARVVGVDLLRQRVNLARSLGARAGGTPGSAEVEEAVSVLSGGHGADSVIIAAAGAEDEPIRLAAELARDRATITVVGDVGLDVPRRPFYAKELQLRVSRSYGPGRYDRSYEEEGHDYPIGFVRWTERRLIEYFFEEVASGNVRLEELMTHEFPVEEAWAAYAALDSPDRMAILLRYPDARSAEPQRRTRISPTPAGGAGRARVGLIGPGQFARSTLLPLLKRAGIELVAVAGTTPARSFGVARRWRAGFAVSDPDELIEDPSIDIVVIATRHDSHAELAARALATGKAVFVEKPLAIDSSGLDELIPLLDAGGRLVVDFNRSAAPATRRVIEHFPAGAEPLHVAVRVNAGALPQDHWLRDMKRGGGRLIGEGCHFVDLVSALTRSRLDAIQVAPLGGGPRTPAGDSFCLTLTYESGSVGVVSYIASGHRGMRKERIEVLGAGRSAVIDDFRRARLYPSKSRRLAAPSRQDKGHSMLLAEAFRFFRDGGEPPIPYERMIETTRATLLAAEALPAAQPRTLAL